MNFPNVAVVHMSFHNKERQTERQNNFSSQSKSRRLIPTKLFVWVTEHPRRPRGSQSGREKRRDESFQVLVRTHEQNSVETVRRLGAIIQSNFLCPIGSQHPLEFLEIARWESVPTGSFTRTWKLSSRPFSGPDWLPLGLRGWSRNGLLKTS